MCHEPIFNVTDLPFDLQTQVYRPGDEETPKNKTITFLDQPDTFDSAITIDGSEDDYEVE